MDAAACPVSLSITNCQNLLKLMSIRSVVQSNHLILCHPLFLLPSFFPSINVFQWVSCLHQVAKVLEFQLQHQFSSIQISPSVVSNSLWPNETRHTRPPCPSPTPRACSNAGPLSRSCYLGISSSAIPFSSCLQSFPVSRSFQMSQFFESGGQRIGVSASASVLSMNIQDWFPSGWTGWISLQSKGLSRVFSNTTVQKHQFFGTQLFW